MAENEGRRAWGVLAACLVAVLLASGARFAFAVFILPIEAELGWDRATLSAAASVNVLAYGLGQLAAGPLVDRWGARWVMVGSLLLMAGSAYGMSQATTTWELFLYQGLLPGLGFGGAALLPASTLLLGWFPRRPALAVGVASSALPAGQALFVPLAAVVVPSLGWRLTYLGLGLSIALVAVPLVWLLAHEPPRRRFPHGPAQAVETAPRPRQGWGLVVILSLGFLACGLTDQLVTIHLVPFASGLGMSPVLAASAQSVLTIAGIGGSIAAGRASDVWSARGVSVLQYLLRAVTLPLLLLFAVTGNPASVFVFALLFGPTYISNVAPAGRLLRERYGQARLGSYMGVTQFVHQFGAAIGVTLGGLSFTLAGSYGPSFVLATAAALAGALVSLALPSNQSPSPQPDAGTRSS